MYILISWTEESHRDTTAWCSTGQNVLQYTHIRWKRHTSESQYRIEMITRHIRILSPAVQRLTSNSSSGSSNRTEYIYSPGNHHTHTVMHLMYDVHIFVRNRIMGCTIKPTLTKYVHRIRKNVYGNASHEFSAKSQCCGELRVHYTQHIYSKFVSVRYERCTVNIFNANDSMVCACYVYSFRIAF